MQQKNQECIKQFSVEIYATQYMYIAKTIYIFLAHATELKVQV